MNNSINILFSSTVIAALVSAIISWTRKDKDSFNEYVTGERAEWRRVIREIASSLPTDNRIIVRNILKRLEPYLNPYGKNPNKYDVMKDSHIWRLIDSINSMIENKAERSVLRDQTALLKEYLCRLLKYDWERSKREVRAPLERRFAFALGIGITVIMIMMQMSLPEHVPDYTEAISILAFTITIGIIYSEDFEDRGIRILRIVVCCVGAISTLVIFYKYYKASEFSLAFLNVWIVPLIYMMAGLIYFVYRVMKNDIERKYREEIKNLLKRKGLTVQDDQTCEF